jgi:DNA-3-methyladenine glycosylase
LIDAKFFQNDPLICAPGLIGMTLIWGRCAGLIVETEAYVAQNDEAAHTFNRPSARAFIGRNRAGAAYVYFNYGVHWMLNVLVKGGRVDGFVLIRALEPRRGIDLMRRRRGMEDVTGLCSGPGKLTQALEITGRDHEKDLCANPKRCFLPRSEDVEVIADERIGITRSAHLPWRFTLRGSPFVSRPVKLPRRVSPRR